MPTKKYSQSAAKRMDSAILIAGNALHEAREVIAESDNYAMACDGPVLHSRQAMSDEQFDRMWKHVSRALRILRECRR